MVAFGVGAAFLLIGVGALITLTDSWWALSEWFDNAGLVGAHAWSFVITSIATIAGYGILRKATPRN